MHKILLIKLILERIKPYWFDSWQPNRMDWNRDMLSDCFATVEQLAS